LTYCIGLKLEDGLVLLSDTRTNAGVDNVSRYRKMFTWEVPNDRALAVLTAGNLSITQGVITRLNREIADFKADPDRECILNAESMFRVAQIVGDTLHHLEERHRESLEAQGAGADASLILAGQRANGSHRLYMIYSAGNFVEATDDTPFFQLGEHKYGKPILDRVITPATPIPIALKAAFVSMDSTLRSNLSVGMPLDLAVIKTDALAFHMRRRIEPDDPEFQEISAQWSIALRNAFDSLPEVLATD
jgi:putative proteasome-type protease